MMRNSRKGWGKHDFKRNWNLFVIQYKYLNKNILRKQTAERHVKLDNEKFN